MAHTSRPRPEARFSPTSGYHSPDVEVDVRLNTNESPYLPPAEFFERLSATVHDAELNRYPDLTAWKLREAIARLHGVAPENVFCGNGSDEVLLTIALAYGGQGTKTLVFEPTFSMHALSAKIAGGDVLAGSRDEHFHLRSDELIELAPQADIAYLCSPNNPTGVAEAEEHFHALLEHAKGMVVVDEAYGQFAEWTAEDAQNEETPLLVLHTFSKTWSMAGVRLGYALGPRWAIESLWATALPYHLSQLTQAAGVIALDYQDHMHATVTKLKDERDRVQQTLDALGVTTWPSQANFILFRPDGYDANEVWQKLVDQSVLIRNCSSWLGLDNCLRVTIGTEIENDRFLEALKGALR